MHIFCMKEMCNSITSAWTVHRGLCTKFTCGCSSKDSFFLFKKITLHHQCPFQRSGKDFFCFRMQFWLVTFRMKTFLPQWHDLLCAHHVHANALTGFFFMKNVSNEHCTTQGKSFAAALMWCTCGALYVGVLVVMRMLSYLSCTFPCKVRA